MDKYKCSRCDGTGQVELTGVFAETLQLLRRQKGEVIGAALATMAGCANTTMNNRLNVLEQLGFARSRRYGRKRLYRATK